MLPPEAMLMSVGPVPDESQLRAVLVFVAHTATGDHVEVHGAC